MSSNRSEKGRGRLKWPWWLSVVAAAISYAGLKYGVQKLHRGHPDLDGLVTIFPELAPIVAILFLLLGAKQLYDDAPPPGAGSGGENGETGPESCREDNNEKPE
ncbi:hypothetical protein [Desulforhopalus singaporensis]|uniref:Uncharacterized protein n=1 Tax=Desulforhopalus singaporensis TaxID=91360 RepID=A0A1H0M030_9BACT|nr:hypothetical protein [Desulforhopalus singaporensis]SDO73550.1 hypothetical protein SAMN05660330_00918 [Desulforhopalus singaporensis]